MAKRILIIANKYFEATPLVSVLLSLEKRPEPYLKFEKEPSVDVPLFFKEDETQPENPFRRTKQVFARLALKSDTATAEVWCISDLMDLPSQHKSSSWEKARVLPSIFNAGPAPALVIAFGTGAYPSDGNFNGSVSIGGDVYLHDGHPAPSNPESGWVHTQLGTLVPGTVPRALPSIIGDCRASIRKHLVSTPLVSAPSLDVIHDARNIAVSSVNITNSAEYDTIDPQAKAAADVATGGRPVVSVETTHGLIRLVCPSSNFMFVTGNANGMGRFPTEVKPREFEQNFAAAHNAGIALAWMLPALMA